MSTCTECGREYPNAELTEACEEIVRLKAELARAHEDIARDDQARCRELGEARKRNAALIAERDALRQVIEDYFCLKAGQEEDCLIRFEADYSTIERVE